MSHKRPTRSEDEGRGEHVVKKKKDDEEKGEQESRTILLHAIGEMLDEKLAPIKQDVGALKQDVGALKQDVGALKQDVEVLKQDVGVLKRTFGRHNELLLRPLVAQMFGSHFAQQYTIKSLHDLAALATTNLLEAAAGDEDDREAKAKMRRRNARKLALALGEHVGDFVAHFVKVHQEKLRSLVREPWTLEDLQTVLRLEKSARPGKQQVSQMCSSLMEELSVLEEDLGDNVIGFCKAAAKVLRRPHANTLFARQGSSEPNEYACSTTSTIFLAIADYWTIDSQKEKVAALIRCGGIGISLATWVASGHTQFEVEIDVRGQLNVMKLDGSTGVSIDTGEIKSDQKEIKHAAQQLRRTTSLISWAVQVLYPSTKVHAICRIFIPKTSEQLHEEPPKDDADKSFIVHRL